ncbi:MAG: hypothetical protein ACRDRC_00950 [Pseudonocardiaceae bacterium]
MADKIRCTVTGPCAIAGADGRDVNPGGTVELDPVATNIDALVAGGHVELSKTAERQLDKASG